MNTSEKISNYTSQLVYNFGNNFPGKFFYKENLFHRVFEVISITIILKSENIQWIYVQYSINEWL